MPDTGRAISLYLDILKRALTASIYDESAWEVKTSRKGRIGRLFYEALRAKSLLVVRAKKFDVSKRENGTDWPLFGYTMAGHRRLENVQTCVEEVLRDNIPGDFIETGAWRGGTTIFMRALLNVYEVSDRRVWVADSFEGLPVPKDRDDGPDLSEAAILKVSLEQVQSNFARFNLLDDQVCFLKGWFSDTLPTAPIDKLAILRLDGDLYSSTMDSLVNLYHKVSKGGFVIVDDYYSWPSCERAVTDFLAINSLKPEIRAIDWSGAYWKV